MEMDTTPDAQGKKRRYRAFSRNVFSRKEEKELVNVINARSCMENGISRARIRRLAYLYAETKGKKVLPQWSQLKEAGSGWLRRFLIRNQSTLLLNEIALKAYNKDVEAAAMKTIRSLPNLDLFEDLTQVECPKSRIEDVKDVAVVNLVDEDEDEDEDANCDEENSVAKKKKAMSLSDRERLNDAVEAVLSDNLGFREASRRYNVPVSTLHLNVRSSRVAVGTYLDDLKTRFSVQDEEGMVDFINERGDVDFKDENRVREVIYEYVRANNLDYPRQWDNKGMASVDWVFHILRTYKDRLRSTCVESDEVDSRTGCFNENTNYFDEPSEDSKSEISEREYFTSESVVNEDNNIRNELPNSISESEQLKSENGISENGDCQNGLLNINDELDNNDSASNTNDAEDPQYNIKSEQDHCNSESYTNEADESQDETIYYFPCLKEEEIKEEENRDNDDNAIFSCDEEEQLVALMNEFTKTRYKKKSITATRAGQLAYELLRRLNKPYPEIWNDSKSVPLKWMLDFICRHRKKLGLS